MERKQTKLERILIEHNWSIYGKTYDTKKGKHIANYIYVKLFGEHKVLLALNPKRDKIDYYTIENNYSPMLDYSEINSIFSLWENITSEISAITMLCSGYDDDPQEIVEIVESENE